VSRSRRAEAPLDPESRRRMLAIAYRVLGSTHDAEDAVHEGIARWQQLTDEQRRAVREPVAWLTRVIGRICLDQLRSARNRRERYQGIWLPEPDLGASDPADPADRVTLDDSVSYAFLVALEKLTPAERVSFVLHDVFQVPFDEVATTVGRSAAACRRLAVSARRHLAAEPRFDVSSGEHDEIVAAFLEACRGGDLRRLVSLLDPHVVSVSDGGELVRVARKPVVGAETVARYLLNVISAHRRSAIGRVTLSLGTINGRTGIVVREGATLVAAVDMVVAAGHIARIALQVNPEKLHAAEGKWV
jgi:RNA polymerase sigma-70 factor, ECF subfamily